MRQAVAGRVFGERLERVTRIELVTEAWEAFVIPFHHTRKINGLAVFMRPFCRCFVGLACFPAIWFDPSTLMSLRQQ